jgi:hypothetical protein
VQCACILITLTPLNALQDRYNIWEDRFTYSPTVLIVYKGDVTGHLDFRA